MLKLIITSLLLSIINEGPMVRGNPMPFESERISPISLSKECNNVKIIEWRGDRKESDVATINDVCNKVVDGFPKFIKEMGGEVPKTSPKYSLSIIPGGNEYRNLNDHKYRFVDRPKFCSVDGRECRSGERPFDLIGYTDFINDHIFINNKINRKFQNTLAHEMFHELSQESGLYDTYKDPIMDERLADKFSEWLGY
jgi:hypothetical protein